jgi:LPXTG-site transpeptidase (sortase) family protein
VPRRRALLAVGLVLLVLSGAALIWRGASWQDAGPGRTATAVVIEPLAAEAIARDAPPALEPGPLRSFVSDGETLNPAFAEAAQASGDLAQAEALVAAAVAAEEARARADEAQAVAATRRSGQTVAATAQRRWGTGSLLLSLPSIGVDAATTPMGMERDGVTPATPNSAWGVAWYHFTAYPGSGGNAVFSGHVDWYTGAPAVFGGLRNVGAGDPLYAVLPDGTPITYRVAYAQWVRPETADVNAIFGATGRDAITIITCGGAWDAVAKDYSHRLIVRAYRTG